MPEARPGVAGRLHDLLVQRFGSAPALALSAWDGSRAGAGESVALYLRSRQAVRRLLWTPGPLGVAQAYVTDQIDVDGDFDQAVGVLLDYLDVTRRAGPPEAADRKEIVRVAVVTGAVGPAAPPPPVSLAAVDGYAAIDVQITELLAPALARSVLGAGAVDGDRDGARSAVVERYLTYPEPLSALVRRWEEEGNAVENIRRVDEEQVEVLRAWSDGLERNWDAVRAAVGQQQARAWRLGLVLDREHLLRGAVAAYQVCGVGRGR
ncbi:MAG: hypothetical protein ACRDO8_13420 [Nocardioidaceae bacterium]